MVHAASVAPDAIARRFMRGFGAVVSFNVHGGAERADAICRSLRITRQATGLGGVESTVERRAAIPGQTHLPPELVRLSVGCEHVNDLWADLDQALAQTAGVEAGEPCGQEDTVR